MMLKKIAYPVLVLFLLSACGGNSRVDLSEKSSTGARRAAEYFYSLLVKGDAKMYVDNMSQSSEMDSCKYSQFVDLIDQFLYEEKEIRGGILVANATEDKMIDTISMVYLDVLFGDSTREEIMLPLVYSRGRWWLR
jgi:hypothetical protein